MKQFEWKLKYIISHKIKRFTEKVWFFTWIPEHILLKVARN